jgi:hypothetical protein
MTDKAEARESSPASKGQVERLALYLCICSILLTVWIGASTILVVTEIKSLINSRCIPAESK